MSKKFTKGPWTIEHDREFDECIIYAEREEDRVVICEVGTYVTVSDKDHSIDLKQIKANAKLLADAWQLPDLRREISELKAINKEMYEALETIDETYKYRRIPDIRRKGHTILKDEIRGGAVFTYDDIKKVREALRKARGEEE